MEEVAMARKDRRTHGTSGAVRAEGIGPLPLHGSSGNPALPNLAGAQIPGPGTGHILAGEGSVLPDDVSDPFEQEGHEHLGAVRTGRFRLWLRGFRRG
jgi:hypothetical protein